MRDCFSPVHHRSTVPIVLVLLAALVLSACDVDSGTGSDNASNDASNDEPPPSEPREPDELPGTNTEPGEDPCGGDPWCHWDARGVGTTTPFEEDHVQGAELDEDGAVTLDDTTEHIFFAWIPNTGDGTISRFDTRERREVGRYQTDPQGANAEPSRTAIGSDGAVYVANRNSQTVTKIALAPHCPTSGPNVELTTSTGPDEVLDWGDDDCVIWNEELSGHGAIEAVAAQDDGEDSYLWVGAGDGSIWKLDGDSGTVLFRTDAPVAPNGFALDDEENLWISPYYEAQLGRIDTTRCRDHDSCDVEICDGPAPDCVKEQIDAPALAYGIAVDPEQRIWMGGDLMRYDPGLASGDPWLHIDPQVPLQGVAADEEHSIYGAGGGDGLFRFSADNPEMSTLVSGTANRSVTAADIDYDGYVWAVNRDHNDTFVIDPGPGLYDGEVDERLGGLDEPHAYSELTGDVTRFDDEQLGAIRQVFERCDPIRHAHTEWQTLRFDARVEGGSRLEWRARGALEQSALDGASWHELAATPPTDSPIDLRAKLAEHDLERANYIEIEARLRPGYDGQDGSVPRLQRLDVIAECPEVVG